MKEAAFLRIGDSLDPDRQLWPEGPHYNYAGGEHELLLGYERPTLYEAVSVQEAPCRFALFIDAPLLLLLHQFGDLPWGDAPFEWHKMSKPPELPSLKEGHALLRTTLIDTSRGGLIVAFRVCTFSPAFTHALHSAMHAQALAPPPHPDETVTKLHSLYRQLSSEQIAARCQIRCDGGA